MTTLKPLWPHQERAVAAIFKSWLVHRSTLLVMATGTGKTRTFVEVIRMIHAERPRARILVLAHRSELLTQAMATMKEFGISAELEKAEHRASKGFALVKSDVVVASVQTMKGQRLKTWLHGEFDTIIVDESHHAVASSYRTILDHFEGAKVLGVTATPDRSDGTGLRAVFDHTAFEYHILEAIGDGVLCPIRQIAVQCDDLDVSRVKAVAGRLSDADIEKAMTTDAVLHQVAGPLAKLAEDRQTIVFAATVKQAYELAGVLGLGVGHHKVGVVDGETPAEERAAILDDYQTARTQFIVNVGVLTEGFDAPGTACIAMARPTLSRGLYTQMVGRGTRIAEGKKDCLVLDFVGNSGKHCLVSTADVLAGTDAPDYIRAAVDKALTDGDDVEEAIQKANAGHRARLAQLRQEKESRRVQAEVEYETSQRNPFVKFRGEIRLPKARPVGNPLSDKQKSLLRRHKFPTDISHQLASKIIGELFETKWDKQALRNLQLKYQAKP